MKAYMHWLALLASIIFEVVGTSIMKASQAEGALLSPAAGIAVMLLFIVVSYYLLSRAVLRIPIGVAYAFWEGLGLTFISLISVLYFGERMDLVRAAALAAIMAGVLLVHHGTQHESGHPDAGRPDPLKEVQS